MGGGIEVGVVGGAGGVGGVGGVGGHTSLIGCSPSVRGRDVTKRMWLHSWPADIARRHRKSTYI